MKVGILTVSVSRTAGGLFQSVRRLAQSLASCPGVELAVVSCRDEFSDEDSPRWAPLKPILLRSIGPRGFRYAFALPETLEDAHFDLVHCHGLWLYQSSANLSHHRATGVPYLISPRGMLDAWALKNSRWKKRIAGLLYENAHLREAACLHALCEPEAQAIRAYGLKNPIAIIPNGIDLPDMGPRDNETTGRPDDGQWSMVSGLKTGGRKVLLYLGRIHPKKGLVNLLKAWAQIQKSEFGNRNSEEWVLAIAGWDQGSHEAELKSLAAELGITWHDAREHSTFNVQPSTPKLKPEFKSQSSVLFLGPRFGEEKAACYRNCDAFILPSFSEGLPMAVLEAWAYAKPVLMTPECNLPEGFAANAAIRVAPSAGGIEQGLQELFRTPPSALRTVGESGRQLVAKRFAWPKIAADLKSVYEWVLGGGSRPGCVA